MSNVPAQMDRTSTREIAISSGSGSKIAPQSLDQVVRFAEVMAKAGIALPQHLRDNAGACMAVALQALEWEMSPFAVASKSYAVNGVIAYEAQLIAAVVNSRSGLTGRLKYTFEGSGDDLRCTVVGVIDGEAYEYTSPRKADIKPQNSPLWKSDPQQQIGYYSARAWARRYTPEVLLGVYDREEAQSMRDVTPQARPTLADRMEAARQQAPQIENREGFDLEHVNASTQTQEPEAVQQEENGFPGDFDGQTIDAEQESAGAQEDAGEPEEPEQQEQDTLDPLAAYEQALSECADADAVEDLTPHFAEQINALSAEDKRRAKAMRLDAKKRFGGEA